MAVRCLRLNLLTLRDQTRLKTPEPRCPRDQPVGAPTAPYGDPHRGSRRGSLRSRDPRAPGSGFLRAVRAPAGGGLLPPAPPPPHCLSVSLKNCLKKVNYFCLCWAFIAMPGFSSCGEQGLFSCCGAQALSRGFGSCDLQALEFWVCSWGAQA